MRAALAALLLSACDAETTPPPPSVTVRSERLPGDWELGVYAAAWLPCAPGAVLLGDGRVHAIDGAAPRIEGDPVRAAALGVGDADGDGAEDVVEVRSADGRVVLRRGTAGGCALGAPVEIAPARAGAVRSVDVRTGSILLGISETDAPARLIERDGGGWTERPTPKTAHVITWGLWRAFGRTWYGLDAGAAWIDHAGARDPASAHFAAADPMGFAVLDVGGEPRVFVAGLPALSRLYALRGGALVDTADAAVAGPARTVTWGAHAADLDGDGADDVIALALVGTSANDGSPRAPRVLIQRGGQLVAAAVDSPRVYATRLYCRGDGRRCVAVSDSEVAQLLTVDVRP